MSGVAAMALLDDRRRAERAAAALALVVFLPALFNGFAYDDVHIVVDNGALHSLQSLLSGLTTPYWPGAEGRTFGLWRPLATLGLGLQWLAFGGAPWAFHLVNVTLHALAAALVVRVGSALLPVRVAALAGVVFAVHPVHAEAVANVVGFSELLAAVWSLAALGVLLGVKRSGGGTPPLSIRRVAAVAGLYLAACLTKENAIVLPALVLVVEAVADRVTLTGLPGYLRRRAPLLAAMTVVAVGVLAARGMVLGRLASPTPALGAGLLTEIPRIFTLGEIWFQYLRLSTVPLWLSPDYAPGVVAVTTVWTARGLSATAVVLALMGLGLVAVRRSGLRGPAAALPLGLIWFVVTILPVANVVFVAGVLVAERTMYLPSVGVAWIAGAAAVGLLERRPRVGGVVMAVLALLWVGRTVSYIPVWKTSLSVFDHMVRTVPESGRSQWLLGDALLEAGQGEEAVAAYARALGRLGGEIPFLTRTAGRLHGAGYGEAAKALARRAWIESPDHGSAPQLLAVISAGEGDWEATVEWARATLAAEPDDPVGWHLLSVGLAERGEWVAARDAREALLTREGRDVWLQWYWLTELRARAGDPDGARRAADSARVRAPGPEALRQIDSLLVAVGAGGPL